MLGQAGMHIHACLQAAAAGAGQVQRSRDFSQHGMRQQQASSQGGAAWSPAMQAGGPMQARTPRSLQV